jgi:hypothetical protein
MDRYQEQRVGKRGIRLNRLTFKQKLFRELDRRAVVDRNVERRRGNVWSEQHQVPDLPVAV